MSRSAEVFRAAAAVKLRPSGGAVPRATAENGVESAARPRAAGRPFAWLAGDASPPASTAPPVYEGPRLVCGGPLASARLHLPARGALAASTTAGRHWLPRQTRRSRRPQARRVETNLWRCDRADSVGSRHTPRPRRRHRRRLEPDGAHGARDPQPRRARHRAGHGSVSPRPAHHIPTRPQASSWPLQGPSHG